MCSCTDCMSWFPSSRPIVVVSGLKEPALMFVVPPVRDGENGRLAPGHGVPFGPEVMLNVEVELAASVPDHGAKDALVV